MNRCDNTMKRGSENSQIILRISKCDFGQQKFFVSSLWRTCDDDNLLIGKMKALRRSKITRPQRAVTHNYAFENQARIDRPNL